MRNTRALTTVAASVLAITTLAACGSNGTSASGTSAANASSPAETANSGATSGCTPAHPGVATVSKGTLTVLVYVSPPYTIKLGNTYGGVDSTIVKKLAQMECLTLKQDPVAPAALIASVKSQRGDVAIGGIYYTKQRAKTLNLSVPMYRDGMALLSRETLSGKLSDLHGKSVGVVQGYLWSKDIQTALGSANVKIYQAEAGMLTDLKTGRLDAAVLTNAEAGYRAKQNPQLKATAFQATPKVDASQKQNNVVLAIPKQETALTKALDADINKLVENGFVANALKKNGMDPDLAGAAKP